MPDETKPLSVFGGLPIDPSSQMDKQALAMYRQAREAGNVQAMRRACQIMRQCLDGFDRQEQPMEWAKAQSDLGNMLRNLGELELNPEYLQAAGRCYYAALEEFTRELAPAQWATLQSNLGHTFRNLGRGGNASSEPLKIAVKAYQAALEELPRWRVPMDWAKTQNNLASALAMLGWREASTTYLEAAAEAYRQALAVFEDNGSEGVLHLIGSALHNLAQVEQYLAELRGKVGGNESPAD